MSDSKHEHSQSSVHGADDQQQPAGGESSGRSDVEPRALTGPLRPLVDLAAGINVGVHVKLLSGFLVGALLLLGMGILSLVVINRMSQRVDDLTQLQERVDLARQMEYGVT